MYLWLDSVFKGEEIDSAKLAHFFRCGLLGAHLFVLAFP